MPIRTLSLFIVFLFLVPLIIGVNTQSVASESTPGSLYGVEICIDPGHGGSDPGAVGYVVEKDIVLSVAEKVAYLLEKDGAEVIMTRTGDYYVSLSERVDIANSNGCDIFVSIHANAAESSVARGFEIYHYYGSYYGDLLATYIHDEVLSRIDIPDRGVKEAGFYVLRHTRMPAVLVELGFVTNVYDAEILADTDYQWQYAIGILYGIQRYFGVEPHLPIAEILGIRYHDYGYKARFVIDLSKATSYTAYYWSSPNYLAVRIHDAVLSQSLIGLPETSDGWHYIDTGIAEVPRIYIKQYGSDVIVVFAAQWVMPYNDFTLTDPDRIVIDIYK